LEKKQFQVERFISMHIKHSIKTLQNQLRATSMTIYQLKHSLNNHIILNLPNIVVVSFSFESNEVVATGPMQLELRGTPI